MSTAFIILAAGRGSRMGRVGDELHKALLPIKQRAILSHLIRLAPADSEIIVCSGYREDQLRDYVGMAHPALAWRVRWVPVPDWNRPGGGPGTSLLRARELAGDRDVVFTSCDTLWERDETLWSGTFSWAAHAPVPAGTAPERWCRIALRGEGEVAALIDKQPGELGATRVYTGLACIRRADLPVFWAGLERGYFAESERQVSGGLSALAAAGRLRGKRITWTDTGDAAAYQRAVIALDGYDWSKKSEATWVLPDTGRVVKWWADVSTAEAISRRAQQLCAPAGAGGAPPVIECRGQMLALPYVHGAVGYNVVKTQRDLTEFFSSPAFSALSQRVPADSHDVRSACAHFYLRKTVQRVKLLSEPLRSLATSVLGKIRWERVLNESDCIPCRWHGDLNLGNMIYDGRDWHLIDWRRDFAGHEWGDWRHDAGKFLAGLRVRWDWARHGDFSPWHTGHELLGYIRDVIQIPPGTEEIGILTLLASAPLHETPLDEVLVARAAEWLGELRT